MRGAGARDAEDVLVGGGVQVDGDEDVLLQPVGFRLADVFRDLLVELRPRLPGPVLGEFARHAGAGAGDQQDFLAGAGVQIHVNEGLPVEVRGLLRGQFLAKQERIESVALMKGRFSSMP